MDIEKELLVNAPAGRVWQMLLDKHAGGVGFDLYQLPSP